MPDKRTPPQQINNIESSEPSLSDSMEVEMSDQSANTSASTICKISQATTKENPSNKDLMDVLLNFQSKMIATDAKLSKHITHTASEFERIGNEIATHESVTASNVCDISEIKGKVNAFGTKADLLAYTVELNKQQTIKNNVTISGIPYTAEENLNELALNVFKHIGANVNAEDINASYRLKYGSMFVVKFVNFETKAAVMESKSNKSIPLAEIIGASMSSADGIVYINTHLIPFFGRLLSHGRRAVKEKLVHSCWMTNNGVVVKCKPESKEISIQSISQLHELCGKSNTSESSAKINEPTKLNQTGKRNAANIDTSPIDKTKQQKKPAIMAQGKTQVLKKPQRKQST